LLVRLARLGRVGARKFFIAFLGAHEDYVLFKAALLIVNQATHAAVLVYVAYSRVLCYRIRMVRGRFSAFLFVNHLLKLFIRLGVARSDLEDANVWASPAPLRLVMLATVVVCLFWRENFLHRRWVLDARVEAGAALRVVLRQVLVLIATVPFG